MLNPYNFSFLHKMSKTGKKKTIFYSVCNINKPNNQIFVCVQIILGPEVLVYFKTVERQKWELILLLLWKVSHKQIPHLSNDVTAINIKPDINPVI